MTFVGHNTQLRWRLRSNRYDHLDRRVQKVTPEATHTYFYDGWMLIKEVVSNTNGTTDVIEYHWGKDLSGTIGGAGGVGGLLYLKRNGAIYVPWYDAYGNVMGYWDAQGNVVAEYTYDAFGKLISSSGPMADVFSFRYSTKYYDPETGLYYYGYRFYSPERMRWITRDPIGEDGGVNLYAMCGNDSVSFFDALGMWRMISGAYLVREKDAKRVEYKAAMKIMIHLDKLNTYYGKEGHRLYDAQLKDMVRTPVSTIKDEIDKNPDNVYLIAHGGLSVNGNVWKKRYYVWNSTDSVVEWLDISHDGKPVTPLSQFGNKLKIQNMYACYLSPEDRKIAVPGVGDVVSRKSNLDQRMTDLLKVLTEKYKKNGKQKCTIKVTVYEGERNRVSGGQFYGMREAKRFWKERSPYNKEGARKWWEE